MATHLTELYLHPDFQAKLKAALAEKFQEMGEAPAEVTEVTIVKDNVGRIEGTTSITATFATTGYHGELAITTQEVWQEYSVEELVEQSEVEIIEVGKN